jgi:hypothetical protein
VSGGDVGIGFWPEGSFPAGGVCRFVRELGRVPGVGEALPDLGAAVPGVGEAEPGVGAAFFGVGEAGWGLGVALPDGPVCPGFLEPGVSGVCPLGEV